MIMTINEFMEGKHKKRQYDFLYTSSLSKLTKTYTKPAKIFSVSPLIFFDPIMFAVAGGFLFIAFVEKGLEIAELEGVAYYLGGFIRILLPLVGIGFFINFISSLPFIWWLL